MSHVSSSVRWGGWRERGSLRFLPAQKNFQILFRRQLPAGLLHADVCHRLKLHRPSWTHHWPHTSALLFLLKIMFVLLITQDSEPGYCFNAVAYLISHQAPSTFFHVSPPCPSLSSMLPANPTLFPLQRQVVPESTRLAHSSSLLANHNLPTATGWSLISGTWQHSPRLLLTLSLRRHSSRAFYSLNGSSLTQFSALLIPFLWPWTCSPPPSREAHSSVSTTFLSKPSLFAFMLLFF